LAPSEEAWHESFGIAVTLDGDRAVVVAHGGLYKKEYFTGAAFVFDRGTGWAQTTKLTAPGQHFDDEYGTAVAVHSNRVVVGAVLEDSAGTHHCAVYAFEVDLNVSPYCFGTACSCSNGHPSAGCGNSTGLQFQNLKGGHLASCGTTSVATDDLVLRASNLPLHQLGLIYVGGARVATAFGEGMRCVGVGSSGVYRFPVINAGAAGVIELGPGVSAHSGLNFPAAGHINAGQSWNFQSWYRDPGGFCGSAHNLSNALAVTFTP
jgi:hypothetical protein